MSDDLEVSREDYDPNGNPGHRVPPVTVPELVAPSLPSGREISVDPVASVAPVPPEVQPPAEPVMDVRVQDRPHFLRNVAGVETCGQDGEPWPCTEYRRTVEMVEQIGEPTGRELVDLEDAAAAVGLSSEELRARIRAGDRRYR